MSEFDLVGHSDVSQFMMHLVCHFLTAEQVDHVGSAMKDGKVDITLSVAGIELPLVQVMEELVRDVNKSFEDAKARIAYDHLQKEGFDPVLNLLNEWSDRIREKIKAYND